MASGLPLCNVETTLLKKSITAYEASLTRRSNEKHQLETILNALETKKRSIQGQGLALQLGWVLIHNDRGHDLQSVDAEMHRAGNIITRVDRETAYIHDLLGTHKRMLSWYKWLPNELWAAIFVLCLPEDECIRWSLNQPPFVFTQVCSTWRQVALGTPRLWASLSLHITSSLHWKKQFDLLIQRSGVRPLSLELLWYPQRDELEETSGMLYDLLLSFAERWQNLRLYVPLETLQKIVDIPLPSLKHLTVGGTNLSDPVLPSLPNLISISFDGIYQDPRLWDIPWKRITSLTSRFPLPVEETLVLCAQCPKIERFHLRVDRMTVPPSRFIPNLTLPYLKSLTVLIEAREDGSRFFDYLELPQPSELEISFVACTISVYGWTWMKEQIGGLVTRSSCPLRKVFFKGILPHDGDLLSFVERIPSLRQIVVSGGPTHTLPEDTRNILKERTNVRSAKDSNMP